VIEPGLIQEDPTSHAIFQETVEQQWNARRKLIELGASPEVALYVLPNATALRFEESGSLLHLLHKWNMRTCMNAQREIWEASMDEVEQVRGVHPELVTHVGPPCVTRNGLIRPRCTEGTHFCGVPVWKHFPDIARKI
jgi:thymidylate synthase ThyX